MKRLILLSLAALACLVASGCDGKGDAALSEKEKQSQKDYLEGGIKFGKDGQPANAPPSANQ